jgi:hypothetical protein
MSRENGVLTPVCGRMASALIARCEGRLFSLQRVDLTAGWPGPLAGSHCWLPLCGGEITQ